MGRKSTKIINNESDEEDIEPTDLIDTQENKPKATQHEELTNTDNNDKIDNEDKEQKQKRYNYVKLEYKQVSKLTQEEKDYLIDLYKNGGEDEFYKVYFYKNGTNKIVKKKQPPKYNTTKRLLQQAQLEQANKTPMMTTEQILMEHVIDLEAKYATLYQKHKKLKKNYKSLHEDIYCDSDDDYRQVNKPSEENEAQQQEQEQTDTQNETSQEPQQEQPQTHHEHNEFQNNYINRLRRPQKGYRKMMASMY